MVQGVMSSWRHWPTEYDNDLGPRRRLEFDVAPYVYGYDWRRLYDGLPTLRHLCRAVFDGRRATLTATHCDQPAQGDSPFLLFGTGPRCYGFFAVHVWAPAASIYFSAMHV